MSLFLSAPLTFRKCCFSTHWYTGQLHWKTWGTGGINGSGLMCNSVLFCWGRSPRRTVVLSLLAYGGRGWDRVQPRSSSSLSRDVLCSSQRFPAGLTSGVGRSSDLLKCPVKQTIWGSDLGTLLLAPGSQRSASCFSPLLWVAPSSQCAASGAACPPGCPCSGLEWGVLQVKSECSGSTA